MKKYPHDKRASPRRATETISGSRAGAAKPPAPTDWNHVSQWYDALVGEQGSDHHQQVLIPGVLRLVQPRADMRILDLACGQGVMCRAMAAAGAEVTGVDLAADLIGTAVQRSTHPNREKYCVGDARRLEELSLPAESFDAAVCLLAIANMTPLSPIWAGCRSLLKPGGQLVIVLLHPCFRIPGKSNWGWDDREAVQYRRIDGYLTSAKVPIQMHPGTDKSVTTTTFHRPLQAYVNTLGSAGLLLEKMEEWISRKQPPAGRRFSALDASRREIPLFMALSARKVPFEPHGTGGGGIKKTPAADDNI